MNIVKRFGKGDDGRIEDLEKIIEEQNRQLAELAAATSADKTPLDVLHTEGYEEPANYTGMTRRLIGHFWTRGLPEITNFGLAHARVVHGAPATAVRQIDSSLLRHAASGLFGTGPTLP